MNTIVNFRKCTLSDEELLNKVDQLTDQIYQDGKIPARHIPARPDDDYDLLVGELIFRYHNRQEKSINHWMDQALRKSQELADKAKRIKELEAQLDNVKDICSDQMSNFVAVKEIQKALESSPEQPEGQTTGVLTMCKGLINPANGLCDTCYQPAMTSSNGCGRLVEPASNP
jgi:DNA repair exonuclease SbcCD ATPase subunit